MSQTDPNPGPNASFPPPYRHSRLVDPNARASGHQLCTVYFRVTHPTNRSYCLQVIEGLARDTVVFRGVSRALPIVAGPQLPDVTIELFNLSGPGFDVARELGRGFRGEFPMITFSDIHIEVSTGPIQAQPPLPNRTLSTFPLPATSVDGISPDSLLLYLAGDPNIDEIAVTGFSEGFSVSAGPIIVGGMVMYVGALVVAGIIKGISSVKATMKTTASAEVYFGKMEGQLEWSAGSGISK